MRAFCNVCCDFNWKKTASCIFMIQNWRRNSENLKHGVPHLLPKDLYLLEINRHIFVKLLVCPLKFDNTLLVVTFFTIIYLIVQVFIL